MNEPLSSNERVSVENGFYIVEDADGRCVREASSSEKRLWAEIERLRAAIREHDCPHWQGAYEDRDNGSVGGCVDGKHCTCGLGDALVGQPVETTGEQP